MPSAPESGLQIPPPPRLVAAGRAQHGWFQGAVRVVNLMDEDIGGLMGRWAGGRRMRLKQWQFFLLDGPEAIAAVAVVNAGYVGNAFAWVYDKAQQAFTERNVLLPLARGLEVSASSVHGTTRVAGKGVELTVLNRYVEGVRTIQGRFPAPRGGGAFDFDMRIEDVAADRPPMVVSWPVAEGRSALAHKVGGLPCSGSLRVGDRLYAFPDGLSRASMDHTQGFFGTRTSWRWASMTALSDWGAQIAIDVDELTNGETQNRNCFLWIDRALIRVATVRFQYSQAAHDWHIRSQDGRIDLHFHPLAVRRDRMNAGLVSYDFAQPIGTYKGTVVDDDDRVHEIKQAWGVAEEHHARW